MALRLRDNLYWCECGGRAIFLDTQKDKYFCLPRRTNDAFLRLSQNASAARSEGLRALVSRGLLVDTPHQGTLQPPAEIDRPDRDWAEEPADTLSPVAILRAIASELNAARRLRTTSLQAALDHVGGLRARAHLGRSGLLRSVQAVAAAEAWASLITRSHNRCLVRALAAHSLCKRSGAHSELVFGVVGHPFSAHCLDMRRRL